MVINEMRPLGLTLSIANLPSVTNYPGSLFLSSLGVDPTMLTTNIIVLVCEYCLVCLLALGSLWLRMAALTQGWIA